MKKQLNPLTALWIGIRVQRFGKASKILARAGFWRDGAANTNNRNGCDFIMPCGSRTLADLAAVFESAKTAGLVGIAFQWTDIQWKHNAGITDAQWQARIQMGIIYLTHHCCLTNP